MTFENFPGTAPAYGLRRARAPAPLYLPAVSNLFLQFANKNDLYLDAVLFKPPLEFTLVRVQLPSNSLIDWENSEDAQLCAFVESIYEQLDNITADDCSVYSSEQGIRFVRANILGNL